ncbi:hypothetical protein TWF481_006848 [Arthrobotrys musiformis]|uniref:Uncharacterized protein n=1 Tax=Arthrobotrys musiformis TaxID=47236 RepID=A0AAV9WC28_9PEZI
MMKGRSDAAMKMMMDGAAIETMTVIEKGNAVIEMTILATIGDAVAHGKDLDIPLTHTSPPPLIPILIAVLYSEAPV